MTTTTRIRVAAAMGTVGRTSSATTCHPHVERWSAPGHHEGGSPQDPLPLLPQLDV